VKIVKKTRSLIALVTVIQLGVFLFAGTAYAGKDRNAKLAPAPAPAPLTLPGFHRGG
jgi:hypothetical protein